MTHRLLPLSLRRTALAPKVRLDKSGITSDAESDRARAATQPADVRRFLQTLARDERLAQGNGRLGVATAIGGALAVCVGAFALMLHNGPIGLDATPTPFWTVVGGGLAACGGGVLVALENHRSTQPPAIATPFRLTIWRGNQPSATLHRDSYLPRAMRTHVKVS